MKKSLRRMFALVTAVAMSMAMLSFQAVSAEEPAEEKGPIGIISAMSNELKVLVENTEISETKTIGGVDYHVGRLAGQEVVLVKAGIGKALAAAGTATLINEFDVSGIVFTGIAGGVGDEVKVMDQVIATDLVFHDYGTQTNDGFAWNGNSGVAEDGTIPVDEALSALAYENAVQVLGKDHVFKGTIATGDQFVASADYVKWLQEEFDALACEMEGAAVARIAAQYEVPVCVIRAMSDKADGAAHETYENFGDEAASNSAEIVIFMMRDLANRK